MGFWFTFFLWAATFVISDYFRAKLPAQEPSGEGDFQSPTSTEGRKVPQVVGGTVKVKGPNTLYYGDWDAEAVTVETGLIFKRDETVGYKYRVAVALGQFQGEADGMTGIYIGDDKVWDYVTDNGGASSKVVDINLPELFGGDKQGGGFVGRIRAFTGESGQPVSTYLASKNPLQSAWPGFVYVVVTDSTETAGADIGESNSFRDIRIEWRTFNTSGLGNELSLTSNRHYIGRDSNPISAAYRVLNNPDFCIATGDVNFGNFQTAANTCHAEGLGYSQLIDSELEAFEILAEIEKHIDGYIGPNPTNGLIEVKLARNDYTPASEFQANEENIIALKNYAKPEWPQTKNEVKVRFVNREKDYSDDHAVAQDMAGRLIAGRPQSITIRFPGLRDAAAANIICTRTSRAYFWPIAKFEMELDRTAYALRPGDIVMVTHSDINATDLPTRITRVRTGDPVQQTIKVDVVEDVFEFSAAITADPPATGHVPPDDQVVTPTVVQRLRVPRWLMEINDEPLVTTNARYMFLVKRDPPNSGWKMQYRSRNSPFSGNWTTDWLDDTENPHTSFTRYGTLRADLDQLYWTANDGTATTGRGGDFSVDGPLSSLIGTYNPAQNFDGLAVINPGGSNKEFIAIKTITADGVGIKCDNVIRGVGYSPIREHAAGEPIFFIDTGAYILPNVRPDQVDAWWGLATRIAGIAPGGEETFSGNGVELNGGERSWIYPYPPTGLKFPQYSTNWFPPTASVDASAGAPTITAPTGVGVAIELFNRRFDQANPIYGSNSNDDLDSAYATNAFSDVDPSILYWLYDLDTYPNPTHAVDHFYTGELLSQDDRVNAFTIPPSAFQDEATIASGVNVRFEFRFKNTITLLEVAADAEGPSVQMDKIVTWIYGAEQYEAVADTALLLHFEGEDKTTQVIDYSPYDHPIALNGAAEIDAITGDTGMGESLLLTGASADYASVELISPDQSDAFILNTTDGFVIQCRARFATSAPGASTGERTLIAKWDEAGNQRQFWFGFNNNRMAIKLSADGTSEVFEESNTATYSTGTWYELTVCVFGTNTLFFRNGAFINHDASSDIGALFNGTAPVLIGKDSDDLTVGTGVNIDEVRIIRKPVYKGPYTKNTTWLPGRDRIKVLHANWENAADLDTSYATDDLNRYSVTFPINEATKIDSSQSKFGTKSLYCAGVNLDGFDNSDGVAISGTGSAGAYADNFDFGVRDFTMECFVRFAVLPSAHTGGACSLITKYNRGPSPFNNFWFAISKNATPTIFYEYRDPDNVNHQMGTSVVTIAIDTWYHVAICRKAGVMSIFFDGNRVGIDSSTYDNLPILNHDVGNVCLGRLENNTTNDHWALNGWLDEVRIINGEAIYDGATYTVPTAAFPTDPLPEVYVPPPVSAVNTYIGTWQPTNL